MGNKVEICGVDTSKIPVLTPEEKTELFIRMQNGDKEARNIFINGNLRLVLSVIKRFYGRGENVDDLFQVGCIGLIKAMDNFDLSQNVQFSTYAVPMIIGEVKRFMRDDGAIKVSRTIKTFNLQINKFIEFIAVLGDLIILNLVLFSLLFFWEEAFVSLPFSCRVSWMMTSLSLCYLACSGSRGRVWDSRGIRPSRHCNSRRWPGNRHRWQPGKPRVRHRPCILRHRGISAWRLEVRGAPPRLRHRR